MVVATTGTAAGSTGSHSVITASAPRFDDCFVHQLVEATVAVLSSLAGRSAFNPSATAATAGSGLALLLLSCQCAIAAPIFATGLGVAGERSGCLSAAPETKVATAITFVRLKALEEIAYRVWPVATVAD